MIVLQLALLAAVFACQYSIWNLRSQMKGFHHHCVDSRCERARPANAAPAAQ